MTTKFTGYPLFGNEVVSHEGVFLFYLEVGMAGCMTFNDNLLELNFLDKVLDYLVTSSRCG